MSAVPPWTEERLRSREGRTEKWLAAWEDRLQRREAALAAGGAGRMHTEGSENLDPNAALPKVWSCGEDLLSRERQLAQQASELQEREAAVAAREAVSFQADLRQGATERYLQDVAEAQERAERLLEERNRQLSELESRGEAAANRQAEEAVVARRAADLVEARAEEEQRSADEAVRRAEGVAAARAAELEVLMSEATALRAMVAQHDGARESKCNDLFTRLAAFEQQAESRHSGFEQRLEAVAAERSGAERRAQVAAEKLERLREDFEERLRLAVAEELQRTSEHAAAGRPSCELPGSTEAVREVASAAGRHGAPRQAPQGRGVAAAPLVPLPQTLMPPAVSITQRPEFSTACARARGGASQVPGLLLPRCQDQPSPSAAPTAGVQDVAPPVAARSTREQDLEREVAALRAQLDGFQRVPRDEARSPAPRSSSDRSRVRQDGHAPGTPLVGRSRSRRNSSCSPRTVQRVTAMAAPRPYNHLQTIAGDTVTVGQDQRARLDGSGVPSAPCDWDLSALRTLFALPSALKCSRRRPVALAAPWGGRPW